VKSSSGGQIVTNQALHWNGRKWSKIAVPGPGGTAVGDASELKLSTARRTW
jgi:hypothetical protein